MFLTPTDEQEILKYIKTLKASDSVGPDNISLPVLKTLAPYISECLTFNFNRCMEYGVYPTSFKNAVVIPLHKSGDRSECSNYRPISIINHVSKVFEKNLKDRFQSFFNSMKIFSNQQYGFTKNKSAEDAISALTKLINSCFNNSTPCLAVFLDLAKAFDTVNHEVLLKKLDIYGVRGVPWKLMESYLSHRRQSVRVAGCFSGEELITCGVPQGTVLGPLLFLVYINDFLSLDLKGTVLSYADDTVLFIESDSWEEVRTLVEDDLVLIKSWLDANFLTLNYSKTKYMPFSINTTTKPNLASLIIHTINCNRYQCVCPTIDVTDKMKYLGLVLDPHLRWGEHVDYTIARIRKSIHLFKKLRDILNDSLLKSFYTALVQSILNYGLLNYGTATKSILNKLVVTQKLIIKIYRRKPVLYPTDKLFSEAKLCTIKQLFLLKLVRHMHQNSHSLVPISHKHSTRCKTSNKVKLVRTNNTTARRHYTFLCPKVFNAFGTHCASAGVDVSLTSKKFLPHAKNWIKSLSDADIDRIFDIIS